MTGMERSSIEHTIHSLQKAWYLRARQWHTGSIMMDPSWTCRSRWSMSQIIMHPRFLRMDSADYRSRLISVWELCAVARPGMKEGRAQEQLQRFVAVMSFHSGEAPNIPEALKASVRAVESI